MPVGLVAGNGTGVLLSTTGSPTGPVQLRSMNRRSEHRSARKTFSTLPSLLEERGRNPSCGRTRRRGFATRIRGIEVVVQWKVKFIEAVLVSNGHKSLTIPDLRNGNAIQKCLVPTHKVRRRTGPDADVEPRATRTDNLDLCGIGVHYEERLRP